MVIADSESRGFTRGVRTPIRLVLAAGALTLATPAFAEEPAAAAPVEEDVGSAMHVRLNLDYTTAYFFRGIIQEDTGLILQPSADLTVDFASGDNWTFGAYAGTWHSFHGQATLSTTSDDFVQYWYEADFYAGLSGSIGPVSLTGGYVIYSSPNDAFQSVQEILFTAALDDSSWWGEDANFTLKPAVALAFEIGADFADGANTESGIYFQPSLTPTFTAEMPLLGDVEFAFPLIAGFSLSDYYEDATGDDSTFGYFSAGVKATIPLPVPQKFGNWSIGAGGQVLFLGDTTEQFNTNDDTQFIGTVSLTASF